jgi:hypothetical protein
METICRDQTVHLDREKKTIRESNRNTGNEKQDLRCPFILDNRCNLAQERLRNLKVGQ